MLVSETLKSTGTFVARPDVLERVRMLVLETDEPHPETIARRGTYGAIFNELFTKAGSEHDPPLGIETTMTYVVEPDGGKVPEFNEVDEVHAILVTGSMYDAHGDDPWILKLMSLLQRLWRERPDIRFSGVCFGHQLLCRSLGSTVEQTAGGRWELAHTKIKLTETGQKLFRTTDGEIHLQQMHQDQVMDAPSHEKTKLLAGDAKVRVWGSTEHTPIQGVYITERLFTSQGHLGFDEPMVRRQVQCRVESGGITCPVAVEVANETAHMEHDGLVVAAAILRFFHGDDRDV